MSKNTIALTKEALLKRYSRNIERQSRQQGFWAQFLSENIRKYRGKEVAPVQDTKNPKAPVAIIQSWEDLSEDGGVYMDVPVLKRLVKKGKVGDAKLLGSGEAMDWYWRHMYVNQWMKSTDLPTGTRRQRFNNSMLRAIENYAESLGNHWAEHQEGNIQFAFLYGIDCNLTKIADFDGAVDYAVPFSPANFYVAGHGKVTEGTAATEERETAIKNHINEMMSDNPDSHRLTATRLGGFLYATQGDNIRKVMTPFGMKRIVVMNAAAHFDLKQDPLYIKFAQESLPRDMMQNPYFVDLQAIWYDAIIYVANGNWGVQIDGSGKVVANSHASNTYGCAAYGPSGYWVSESGQADGLDQNEVALVSTLGPGAMNRLWGRDRTQLKVDSESFEQLKEGALFVYQSLVRGDNFDDDGTIGTAGGFAYNDSFAVMACYAPWDFRI